MTITSNTNKTILVKPGMVYFSKQSIRLCAVATSTTVVTLYDKINNCGGIAHFSFPIRLNNQSTTLFAAPSIIALVNLLINSGSNKSSLEAGIFGGADDQNIVNNEYMRGQENTKIAFEILEKLKIPVLKTDIGDNYPREIIFFTANGHAKVSKIFNIMTDDWYPILPLQENSHDPEQEV